VSSRYLSVRWGIDLSKVVLFVGERGDTDYEHLLAGLHKTLILKGSVEYGSEKLLCSEHSFKREDIVPQDSPHISFVEECCGVHDISAALEALGIK
jgi:sucrose-phosphate synthase